MSGVVLCFLLSFCFLGKIFSLSVTSEDAHRIGERVWKNECGGTLEGLTHWNKGENFVSLGIGHFIWYKAHQKERFQETFPALLAFIREQGIPIPAWLKKTPTCPWSSREEFYRELQSPRMRNLRQFLFETRHVQALFIANRLEKSLPQMIENLPPPEKERITELFCRLSQDARGLYALIDYLNFKGSGTSPHETYKGQGWGLLQVLQQIPSSSPEPLVDFVKAAKALLAERVRNSPPERNESRWLKGWHHRVDTYLEGYATVHFSGLFGPEPDP